MIDPAICRPEDFRRNQRVIKNSRIFLQIWSDQLKEEAVPTERGMKVES